MDNETSSQTTIAPLSFYDAWLASLRFDSSRKSYAGVLRRFAKFLDLPDAEQAVRHLLALPAEEAHALAVSYREYSKSTAAPSTGARQVTTLRRLCRDAQLAGIINWKLEMQSIPKTPVRDVRGPTEDDFTAMLNATEGASAVLRRDRAILLLIRDLALSTLEIRSMRVEHVDVRKNTLLVTSKGILQLRPLDVSKRAAAAVASWLEVRGVQPGYLFHRVDQGAKVVGSTWLSHVAIWRLVQKYGKRAGISRPARPHGIRHRSLTTAATLLHGDVVLLAAFSRTKNPRNVRRYIDGDRDLGGQTTPRQD